MDVLKILFGFCSLLILSGCQIGYYFSSAYNQMSLLSSRVPMEKALQDPSLTEEQKRKLLLAGKVREFSEKELHLRVTKNYTTFVKLDRPYVTYVVSAAPKWELKHHLWSYPFVGEMPYKGFFNEKGAKEEEQDLKNQDLDTYMRGVSAYSTLGWFNDPLLSSMLNYADHELVNTLIHETVHTTIFIKSSADFNERLAVFLGNKGMELYYQKEEGPDSKTVLRTRMENEDDRLFSSFISKEIKDLENWYKTQPEKNEEVRQKRIKEIQTRFQTDLAPRLKSASYNKFPQLSLNNARLLVYKTYMQDLSDFERLYQQVGGDFAKFIDKCRSLESSKKPEEDLKKLISETTASNP
jgi:predicted aminopeptidase